MTLRPVRGMMRFILVWVRLFDFFTFRLFGFLYVFQFNVFDDDWLPVCLWVDLRNEVNFIVEPGIADQFLAGLCKCAGIRIATAGTYKIVLISCVGFELIAPAIHWGTFAGNFKG